MKVFITIFFFISFATINSCEESDSIPFEKPESTYYPSPIGWTNDFEHIFTKREIQILDSISIQFEKATTNEIAIVTLKPPVEKADIDTFATRLFNAWEIGKPKKNNGVLILLTPQVRTVVIRNGYGIEKILSNEETKLIISEVMLSFYKEGKYFEGTKNGLLAVIKKLNKSSER